MILIFDLDHQKSDLIHLYIDPDILIEITKSISNLHLPGSNLALD